MIKPGELIPQEDKVSSQKDRTFGLWFNGSLHHQMIAECETIVKTNWTDVVFHDKQAIQKMPPGGVAIWVVHENGTYLCPMYESAKKGRYEIPLIFYVMCRFRIQHFMAKRSELADDSFNDPKYYVIRKGSFGSTGSIDPITFDDLCDFLKKIN